MSSFDDHRRAFARQRLIEEQRRHALEQGGNGANPHPTRSLARRQLLERDQRQFAHRARRGEEGTGAPARVVPFPGIPEETAGREPASRSTFVLPPAADRGGEKGERRARTQKPRAVYHGFAQLYEAVVRGEVVVPTATPAEEAPARGTAAVAPPCGQRRRRGQRGGSQILDITPAVPPLTTAERRQADARLRSLIVHLPGGKGVGLAPASPTALLLGRGDLVAALVSTYSMKYLADVVARTIRTTRDAAEQRAGYELALRVRQGYARRGPTQAERFGLLLNRYLDDQADPPVGWPVPVPAGDDAGERTGARAGATLNAPREPDGGESAVADPLAAVAVLPAGGAPVEAFDAAEVEGASPATPATATAALDVGAPVTPVAPVVAPAGGAAPARVAGRSRSSRRRRARRVRAVAASAHRPAADALVCVREEELRLAREDRRMAEQLATLAAASLANARARERQLEEELRALVAGPTPPATWADGVGPGLAAAARKVLRWAERRVVGHPKEVRDRLDRFLAEHEAGALGEETGAELRRLREHARALVDERAGAR